MTCKHGETSCVCAQCDMETVENTHIKPAARYKHDCDKCVYLGQHDGDDLYFCAQDSSYCHPTLIARYGNDGPEYRSGLCFKDIDPSIGAAYRLACERGVLRGIE